MSKKKQMNTTHFDNKILNLDLKEAMKSYYMDYAMSIIVSRALPDVRDGLKPVHRRILHAMAELKLFNDGKYKKSARTVGEVLGKYHPHGDSSVYDALVRMAQYFSLRYPLVDGHGNFGSIDGDSPAAMRYTESKLAEIANEMLRDIKMNTVDMIPNFDGEEVEPSLLPCRFPNLLVNGSSGIAVGFATNMPPHNLKDAIEQVIYQIDNPNCSIKELVDILKAPDFPLGGIIVNPQDMLSVYSKGSGAITVRSKYHIEDETSIVFTEIPYGINKLTLLDKLVMLKDGYMKKVGKGKKAKDEFVPPLIPQINKIEDLSDEIDGIQIIIDVDNKDNIDTVLKLLFENSQLQDNFNANFTGVMGNTLYEKMSLKEINRHYIMYQKQVIERRTSFQLDKAEKELNRLEGIIKILGDIDKTIEIIKTAKNNEVAKIGLINHFGINEKQAEIILEMKLKRLTCLEVETMKERYENICAFIEKLKKILSSEEEILNVIKNELTDIMNKYSDGRKTELLYEDNLAHIDTKSVEVQDYNCRILLTNSFIKKHMKYSPNHKLKDGDSILCDITTTNKSTLLAFSNKGNRYKLDCSSLTEKKPSEYGDSINRVFKDMDKDEKIIKVVSVENEDGFMLFMFKNGKFAKTSISKYMSRSKIQKNCFDLESELVGLEYLKEDVNVLSISKDGRGLIYNTDSVGVKSGKSKGNKGMSGDVISVIIDVKPSMTIELQDGKGKTKSFLLSENKDEERTWFKYLEGRTGNKGVYMLNAKDTKIVSTKLIK